jgi:hypothetical protein
MKTWAASILLLILTLMMAPAFASEKPVASVPKYNRETEATFRGTVEEVKDRICPVSGGMGAHLILKLGIGKTIEVHLASTKFVRTYELLFNKGDELEVTGSKVSFGGVDTIFAREIKRGNDTFMFRDKQGNPLW